MVQFLSQRRAAIARIMLPLLILAAAFLAIPFASSNFAEDPPPDEEYIVSDSADVSDDGIEDIVTANASGENPTQDTPGRVYIQSGHNGAIIVTIEGSEEGDKFGYSAAVTKSLNNDVHRDLIVGAPKESAGRVYVFHGPFTDEGPLLMTTDDAAMLFASPRPELDLAKAQSDPLQRKVACLLTVNSINQYLNHFDPSGAANIVSVATIYHMLGQDDW